MSSGFSSLQRGNLNGVPTPISLSKMCKYISEVAVHECGHTMGLVSMATTIDESHNYCDCGEHYMDYMPKRRFRVHAQTV